MTDLVDDPPRLSDLTERERSQRFARLQQRLVPLWETMRLNQPGESIVVVPSVTPDATQTGTALQALEERMLFLLLLLRKPRMRVIYVTGRPVPESVVDYYLSLLPGVIPRQARPACTWSPPTTAPPVRWSEKLLARPRVLAEIGALIPDPARCHLVPYTTSALERDLALTLGIPLYGADPELLPFGTKTGCRRLFAEAGVPHPIGFEDVHDSDGVVDALARMRAAKPAITDAIVKLNDGVAGRGNTVVELRDLPAPGAPDERAALGGRVEAMAFEHPDVRLPAYLAQLAQDGGIVEERVGGVEIRSPSVQLRVTPLGEVELLSTHDQLLGGPSGQTYLGCRFPADFGYAREITQAGRQDRGAAGA